jgi:hypothetical protein
VTKVDFSKVSFVPKLGSPGPAGGIVFYDKGNYSNGWRYLEAAPTRNEFTAGWGTSGENVNGTGTAIGTGKRNTEIIVERLKALGENGKAAQMCANLNFGGYKDWFLPSKDELDLMYKNLKQKGLGGFSGDYYWSSSYYDGSYNHHSWSQRFNDGMQDGRNKSTENKVRAVRAF